MFNADDDDSRLSTTSDVTFSMPAATFHSTVAADVTLYGLNHNTGYWESVNGVAQQGSNYEASTTNGVSYDRIFTTCSAMTSHRPASSRFVSTLTMASTPPVNSRQQRSLW